MPFHSAFEAITGYPSRESLFEGNPNLPYYNASTTTKEKKVPRPRVRAKKRKKTRK